MSFSNEGHPDMKAKITFVILFISALSISSCNFNSQEQTGADSEKVDSMQKSDDKLHQQLENAKSDRMESEERTKEAKQVEQNASNAASESRKSLRAEKRAQRARQKADEQAGRTKDAIEKSEQGR